MEKIKFNKKIALFLAIIIITSSLFIVISNIEIKPENKTGFNVYTIPVNYANFTLPYWNPWQQGHNDYDRGMPNMPILSSENRFNTTGFIYQNDSNNLVFYDLENKSIIDLTSQWKDYTVPPLKTHNGILKWYATRQNIYYTQYNNGYIDQIIQIGEIHHYFYIQDYFMNNQTYISKNTTIPVTYARAATTTFGSGFAYYNIYPLTVSNGLFEFIFSSSDNYNGTVSSGIYMEYFFGEIFSQKYRWFRHNQYQGKQCLNRIFISRCTCIRWKYINNGNI